MSQLPAIARGQIDIGFHREAIGRRRQSGIQDGGCAAVLPGVLAGVIELHPQKPRLRGKTPLVAGVGRGRGRPFAEPQPGELAGILSQLKRLLNVSGWNVTSVIALCRGSQRTAWPATMRRFSPAAPPEASRTVSTAPWNRLTWSSDSA